MRIVSLAIVLLLSGCMTADSPGAPGDAAGDEAAPGDGSPSTRAGNGTMSALSEIPWEILDCSFYYATTQADAEKVREHLPEGFEIGQGQVQVAYEYNSCENGTGLAGFVGETEYASVWVGVTPPNGTTGGVFSVIAFDVLIPDEERRTWLQENGVPAHDGGLTSYTASSAQGVERVSYTYSMGDVGEFTVDYAAPQATANAGGTFDQWTGDQLVYWKTDWQTTEQWTASATISIPQESIYADWYATPVVPATLTLGTWDYTDGFIRL